MTCAYAYQGVGEFVDQEAAWDYIHNGYLLAPRTVLKGRKKFPWSLGTTPPCAQSELASYAQQTLEAEMGDIAGKRRAVMFSGGFDSMLIALLALRCGAKVTAVTIQFDDFNPLTVESAVECARNIGVAHQVLAVTAVEFLFAFEVLAGITDEPVLDLDLAVVYAALKKFDKQSGGNVFISGMGSDQWFGNMALEDWPGGFPARLDWAIVDQAAHQRAAEAHGCKFSFPFLSESILTLSQWIPAQMKKDKKFLRALALTNTIPQRGARSEIQVPDLMRRILIKKYGDRAWPAPVRADTGSMEQSLRQIVLGLWLEKNRGR